MEDSMQRKNVVTSFIRRQGTSSDTAWEFLLVQRSKDVSTYPYPHWGAVSGGVEEQDKDIYSRALIEIEEEVGYTEQDLDFVCNGRPVFVDDNGRHFKVHPYLFTLRQDKPVRLNWENVDAVFHTEEAMAHVNPKVPLLMDTLRRVQMSPEQSLGYQVVLDDRTHGAAELCIMALDQLRKDAVSYGSSLAKGVDVLMVHMQNFGYHLAASRPNMAPVGNCIATVLSSWISDIKNTISYQDPIDACNRLIELIDAEKQRISLTNAIVVRNAIAYLGSRAAKKKSMSIMTISYSSNIRDVLKGLSRENPSIHFQFFLSESRPLFEGVLLGKDLLHEENVTVHLVTEAQLNTVFIEKNIDIVIVGADSLSKTGFVNKVGTMALALLANHHAVDLIVVSDISKANHMLGSFMSEEKHRDEVLQAWIDGNLIDFESVGRFMVPNAYFEQVPFDLVTRVISSNGTITPEDVHEYIEKLQMNYAVAFQ